MSDAGVPPTVGEGTTPEADGSEVPTSPSPAQGDIGSSNRRDALFASIGERIGDQIGVYTLLSPIGEGGFGVVWLAERREPMVQRVAIKIIKAGMDSKSVVARFEQERQALALMDHPGIARVFDGGVTSRELGSRPYFVMELVNGESITRFCDRRRLPLSDRLRLFVTVCQAMSHAHARGIVHRDLKPSNVLVQELDGQPPSAGLVKVIDFGVAKALAGSSATGTMLTELGAMIGTPEYMSPEQVEMGGLGGGAGGVGVDERSDVYALGVLLYELLSGCLPFDSSSVRGVRIEEVVNIVCLTDPPTPSARLRALSADERERAAKARELDAASLVSTLRREIEPIPMMAIRKEPARRYQTAKELGDDVQRALDGRALVAGPDRIGYRVRKAALRRFGPRGCALAAWTLASALGVAVALVAPMQTMGVLVQRARLMWLDLDINAGRFDHVRIVRITEGTDMARLIKSEFIAGDPADERSKRLLHARLLEKLARAGVGSVAFDIFFERASDFDAFLGGRADLRPGADVIFGTETWAGGWVVERGSARQARVGALSINLTPAGDVDVALGVFANDGKARALSLAMESLATSMAPAAEASAERSGDSDMLLHMGRATRAPALIQTSGMALLDGPERGAQAGESIAYFPVYVPSDRAIEDACVEYAEVFAMTPARLRETFAGKAVLVADATATQDRLRYSDGRTIGGYAVHAQGIEALIRSFAWREHWWWDALVVAASAGIGAALVGVWGLGFGRSGRARVLIVLGSGVALCALLLTPVLVLHYAMILIHPIAPVCGTILAAAFVGWLRVPRLDARAR